MAFPDCLDIHLEAHNPARNHHRVYRMMVGHDLLGDLVVLTVFGRAGRDGRHVFRRAASPQQAIDMVTRDLERRATAPRRIGTAYRLVGLWSQDDSWLPPGLRT